MQKAGYELAFRNAHYGPRAWFSYQHDILYLVGNDYFNGLHRLPGPDFLDSVFGLEQFATSDLRSVSKIAIKTPSFGSLTPNDYTETLSDVLNMSGSLEELLVVEEKLYQKLVGNGDRLAGLLRYHTKDCMVEGFEVLDCDAADVLAYEIPAGEMVDGGHLRSMETHCMLNEGKNWKECEYFEKIAKG